MSCVRVAGSLAQGTAIQGASDVDLVFFCEALGDSLAGGHRRAHRTMVAFVKEREKQTRLRRERRVAAGRAADEIAIPSNAADEMARMSEKLADPRWVGNAAVTALEAELTAIKARKWCHDMILHSTTDKGIAVTYGGVEFDLLLAYHVADGHDCTHFPTTGEHLSARTSAPLADAKAHFEKFKTLVPVLNHSGMSQDGEGAFISGGDATRQLAKSFGECAVALLQDADAVARQAVRVLKIWTSICISEEVERMVGPPATGAEGASCIPRAAIQSFVKKQFFSSYALAVLVLHVHTTWNYNRGLKRLILEVLQFVVESAQQRQRPGSALSTPPRPTVKPVALDVFYDPRNWCRDSVPRAATSLIVRDPINPFNDLLHKVNVYVQRGRAICASNLLTTRRLVCARTCKRRTPMPTPTRVPGTSDVARVRVQRTQRTFLVFVLLNLHSSDTNACSLLARRCASATVEIFKRALKEPGALIRVIQDLQDESVPDRCTVLCIPNVQH